MGPRCVAGGGFREAIKTVPKKNRSFPCGFHELSLLPTAGRHEKISSGFPRQQATNCRLVFPRTWRQTKQNFFSLSLALSQAGDDPE